MQTRLSKSAIRGLAAVSVFGLMVAVAAPVAGQTGGSPAAPDRRATRDHDPAHIQKLRDFVHYIRIDRTDMARDLGEQLVASGISAREFVDLVEAVEGEERFLNTISRAMRIAEVEPTAASMLRMYEAGRRERVRDPEEIARNIELLTGTRRAVALGRSRLVAAGEYAMPQILESLLQRRDPVVAAYAQGVLRDLGQHAVIPLATALPQLEPSQQEQVVDILGNIGYRTALPFLMDIMRRTDSDAVRSACERAIARLGVDDYAHTADLYRELGEGYYAQRTELTSFPGEDFQLLWSYDPGSGLNMTAIRTEVYHDAMAMRMAERSLELQPEGNNEAVSLWLAANFSREINTETMLARLEMEHYDNPAYPLDRRDATYFAVAAGPSHGQSVLARAIDTRDTPLARRAIGAIEQTAGGTALWATQSTRRPLLEALRYPNRRVQYEAALALAAAQPTSEFEGSERVVPLLASAIRDAAAQYAVVVSSDREVGNWMRQTLEGAGYIVLPVAADLREVAQPIAEAPGIDLIVMQHSPDRTIAMVNDARAVPKLGATPILAITDAAGQIDLRRRYERDPLITVRPSGLAESQLVAAAEDLLEVAAGGRISEDDARQYAARALAALRDLAVSGNLVLDVGDAALPLIAALGESQGEQCVMVAEVLSRIEQKRVQVALMDAALAARGDDRIMLLGKVADSAKRFGNLLERRQVQRLTDLAMNAADREATAAAALLGSLNLPTTNIVPMILGQRG